MTPETDRERRLREERAEAHFQIKWLTWIGVFLLFAFGAALFWR